MSDITALIPSWLWFVMLCLAMFFVPAIANVVRERALSKEYDRNENPAPEDNQIRWDIRHIREDISILCSLVYFQNAVISAGIIIAVAWWMSH